MPHSIDGERVVVSLGGSLLFNENGFDLEYIKSACELFEKLQASGKRLIVVVGGGKYSREYVMAVKHLREMREFGRSEFYGDRVAIAITRANAFVVKSTLRNAYSRVIMELDQAQDAVEGGKIGIGAGLLEGRTTDAVAVLIAERIGAKSVVNMSGTPGIYTGNPKTDKSAKLIELISHESLVRMAAEKDSRVAKSDFVFDLLACKLAGRSDITLHFVNGRDLKEVENAVSGRKHFGTVVKSD
jgi:uridylate kinase